MKYVKAKSHYENLTNAGFPFIQLSKYHNMYKKNIAVSYTVKYKN